MPPRHDQYDYVALSTLYGWLRTEWQFRRTVDYNLEVSRNIDAFMDATAANDDAAIRATAWGVKLVVLTGNPVYKDYGQRRRELLDIVHNTQPGDPRRLPAVVQLFAVCSEIQAPADYVPLTCPSSGPFRPYTPGSNLDN